MWDSKSGRSAPLPKYWPKLRARILLRDLNKCQWLVLDDKGRPTKCGYTASDVDHIGSPSDHRSANLRSLCGSHHATRTAAQGGNAKQEAKSTKIGFRKKVVESHPGIINS